MKRSCLFILGFPRSGTTLLRALLGAHPAICLRNEPELLRAMRYSGFKPEDRLGEAARGELLDCLAEIASCRRHLAELPAHVVESFRRAPGDLSFRQVYESLLPVPDGDELWGEKSLGNVFHIAEIHHLYPNALFVHIVRDPRSALLSYFRKKHARSSDCQPELTARTVRFFIYRALQWCAWQRAVEDAALGGEHMLKVHFEALVREPERELRRICEALDLPFEASMLDATRRENDPVLASIGAYAHQKLSGPIDSARASSREDLPDWATFVIERYGAGAMERAGYALDARSVRPAAKLRVLLEVIRSERRIMRNLERSLSERRARPRLGAVAATAS